MKKKLFLGSLLAGTLAFTACVDDKVPAEVEQLRQQKAAQLTSMATLANAQAQAKVAIANADAQAKRAAAAYNQARADYYNALTQNEIEKAKLAMEEAAVEIQAAQAQLQATLEKAKLELFEAQTALKNNLNDLSQQQATNQKAYIDAYVSAQQTLLDLRGKLANAKILLEEEKAGLVSEKTGLEEALANATEANDNAQEVVEFYQTNLTVWQEYSPNYSAAENALAEAQETKDNAYTAYQNTQTAYRQAVGVEKTTLRNMEATPYYGSLEKFPISIQGINIDPTSSELGFNYGLGWYEDGDVVWLGKMTMISSVSANYTDADGNSVSLPIIGTKESNLDENYITYSKGEGQKDAKLYYYQYVGVDTIAKDAFKNLNKEVLARLEVAEVNDSTEAANALAAANRLVTTLEKQQAAEEAAQAAYKTLQAAREAVTEAGDKATEAQNKALEEAQTAYNKAAEAQQTAQTNLNDSCTKYSVNQWGIHQYQQQKAEAAANANEAVEAARAAYSDLLALENDLTTQLPAFEAQVATLNANLKATAQASVDNTLAWNAYNNARAEVNALQQIVDNNGTTQNAQIEVKTQNSFYSNALGHYVNPGEMITESTAVLNELIAQAQAEAETAQEKLDEAQAALEAYEGESHPDVEAAIAKLEALIAQLETRITAQEAIVATTEAQMKNALGETEE